MTGEREVRVQRHVGDAIVVASFLALAMAMSPTRAWACACCDAQGSRRLVGWSDTGRSALVAAEDSQACTRHAALEVYRATAARRDRELRDGEPRDQRHHCFDLFSEEPDAVADCRSLGDDMALPDGPRSSTRGRSFPVPAESVAAAHVRARSFDSTAMDPMGSGLGRQVRVALTTPAGEEEIARLDVHLARGEYETAPSPLQVVVYPSPNGRIAMVELTTVDEAPGTGLFTTLMHLAPLPESLTPEVLNSMLGPRTPRTVEPTAAERAAARRRREAQAVNRRGLRQARRRRYAEARALFARALELYPDYAAARFNLACMLARLGETDAAFDALEALYDETCPRCMEFLGRVASDEDLASLRDDARFEEVVRGALEWRELHGE